MQIAEVAREAGVSTYTVRFYQRRKLLPETPRSSSNYRNYSRRAVELVGAITGAQSMGFTLFEIQKMTQISSKDLKAAKEIRAAAKAKVCELASGMFSRSTCRLAQNKGPKSRRCFGPRFHPGSHTLGC